MSLSLLSFSIYLIYLTVMSPLSLCFILAYVWNFDQVLYFNPISVSLCVCVRCSQNNWLPVTCSMSCGDNQQHVFTPGFNVPTHTHFSTTFQKYIQYIFSLLLCTATHTYTVLIVFVSLKPCCVRFGDYRKGKWKSLTSDYNRSRYQTGFERNV